MKIAKKLIWPTYLLLMILTLAFCIRFGLMNRLLVERARIDRVDETMVFEEYYGSWETAVYRPDIPYAGEIRLALHSISNGFATVSWPGGSMELPVGPETRWYAVPVHGFVDEFSLDLTDSASMAQVDNLLIVSDWNLPRFLSLLSILWGMLTAMLLACRKKLDWSCLALVLGLSFSLLLGKTVTIPHGWDEDIHRTLTWYLAGIEPVNFSWFVQAISIWDIGYIPGALGAALGNALSLPLVLVYRLGNMTAALAYGLMCFAAVRNAPKYKLTFMAIAAMPTCVFQAGSYTYDGMVIGAALLGCSLLLKYGLSGKRLTAGKGLVLLLLLCVCMLPKPVYALLLLLLFFLPEKCFASARQQRLFRCYVLVMVVWSFVALLMPGQYDNVSGGDERIEGADSALQWAAMQAEPLKALRTFAGYILHQLPRDFLDAPLYAFGSYQNGIPGWGWIISLSVLLASPLWTEGEIDTGSALTLRRRFLMGCLALLPMLILMVTQYIVSTEPGALQIHGMQERYSLPVWPLLCAALMLPEKWRKKRNLSVPAALLIIALFSWMVFMADRRAILSMWLMK